MFTDKDFDVIRPYHDSEINDAMHRLIADPAFSRITDFIFPDWPNENIIRDITKVTTTIDFQKNFMYKAVRNILSRFSDGLTYEGFENIKPGHTYLFVANHRDIFLDSSIFQILLVEHYINTTEITFGDNLLDRPFIIDLAKCNRMLTLYREGSGREFYRKSNLVSTYMRRAITSNRSSMWIAQRNGRTKDGDDKTHSGMLKLLNYSGAKGFIPNFRELNVVPLTISYEYEPCDLLKVKELYISSKSQYVKSPGEDLNSILTGVLQPKGHIHIVVDVPIDNEYNLIDPKVPDNEKIRQLAQHIDKRIYKSYKLWHTNYLAYDLQNNGARFADQYTEIQKIAFEKYISDNINKIEGDKTALRQMFLKLYANPVINRIG